MTRLSARQPGRVSTGHFEGDLGPRVAGAHHKDTALPQLGWIPVLDGMQLHDARIELGGEGGHPRCVLRGLRVERGPS
jgi:hypothetical protein